MTYKILNTLLPTEQREKVLFATIDMLAAKKSLVNSPLAEWGRQALKEGYWWYGCEQAADKEKAIQERVNKFIKLYLSINEKGYDGSEISVFFDEQGQVHTYDGFHRLCIMKYLGMKVAVNVVISNRDPNPTRRGDFPLAETIKAINSGECLYQPCDDPRVKHFKLWRKDSPERLAYILSKITGKTILDIGCAEGYFSRELSKKGFEVTAIDYNKKRVAITRYLGILNSQKINCYREHWQEFVKGNIFFDNILMLSVLHHDIIKSEIEAFKSLGFLKGKTNRLFLEVPLKSSDVKWIPKDKIKETWDIPEKEFITKVETATGLKVKEDWRGHRPMFLLEK